MASKPARDGGSGEWMWERKRSMRRGMDKRTTRRRWGVKREEGGFQNIASNKSESERDKVKGTYF